MNIWKFLDRIMDRLPAWPSERQWVSIWIMTLIIGMLMMADHDKSLWQEETFKDVFKTIVITGLLNMILAFHFSANKADEVKTQNTAKAFEAITATANASTAASNGVEGAGGDNLQTGDTVTMTKTNDTTEERK